jgi:hypothetical protein
MQHGSYPISHHWVAMSLLDFVLLRARRLHPGHFAPVMATGIMSINLNQHRMPVLARALFGPDLMAWMVPPLLTALRRLRFCRDLVADFVDPGRGASFLTLAAGTCVLGSQRRWCIGRGWHAYWPRSGPGHRLR